ncbi:hypothetical protein Tco_0299472 [Tanacetum coccineum]
MLGEEHEAVSMGNTGVVGVVVTRVIGQVVVTTLNPPIGNTGDAAVKEHEVVSMGNTSDESTADKGVIGSNVATTLNPPFLLSPTSLTKDNLRKLEANVLNDAYYDVWLPFASVHGLWNGCAKQLGKVLIQESNNGKSDNLVMVVPNLEGTRYTKEPICVEYKWEPLRCSTCLIFGHSLEDCPKAPKRVVNMMDKGEGGSYRADDEGASLKTTPSIGKKNVLTPVETGNKASTSGVQEEGQRSTPLVEMISGSEDEVESVDNEMASYLASKLLGLDMGLRACWNNEGKHM